MPHISMGSKRPSNRMVFPDNTTCDHASHQNGKQEATKQNAIPDYTIHPVTMPHVSMGSRLTPNRMGYSLIIQPVTMPRLRMGSKRPPNRMLFLIIQYTLWPCLTSEWEARGHQTECYSWFYDTPCDHASRQNGKQEATKQNAIPDYISCEGASLWTSQQIVIKWSIKLGCQLLVQEIAFWWCLNTLKTKNSIINQV